MTIGGGAPLRRIDTVDAILDVHRSAIGRDIVGYRNHVYRVVNLCLAISGDRAVTEKIAITAAFHDLGIWTNRTFDYLAPSISLAREFLAAKDRADWSAEIEHAIATHHKLTASLVDRQSLEEAFRAADWIDVTRGVRRFGVPRSYIEQLFATWPSAGFHRRLVTLTLARFCEHPLSPLPMVRW